MSINILKNYKTPQYTEFKELVLSDTFPWRYQDSDTGICFYSHGLLTRPEGKYSEVISQYSEFGMSVVAEILQHNNIQYKFFLRSSLNCLHPDNDVQSGEPHVDHDFPHINVIIYFTNTGGKTYCEDEFHDPKEDDVILMTGKHWGERPKVGRRIISVNTLYT
jgi:hypothetical protein